MTQPTTVQGAIDLFQAAFAQISGIQDAPADPPDTPDAFPFITTYIATGVARSNTPEDFRALWNLRVDFLVALGELPAAIQTMLTYPESILNAIYDTIKTNEIAAGEVTIEYISLDFAGVTCNGLSFVIHDVKIITAIT
jgi:hypothetical protein